VIEASGPILARICLVAFTRCLQRHVLKPIRKRKISFPRDIVIISTCDDPSEETQVFPSPSTPAAASSNDGALLEGIFADGLLDGVEDTWLGRTQVVGREEHTFDILTYAFFIQRTSSVYNGMFAHSPGALLSSLYKVKLYRNFEDMADTITTNIVGRVILLEKSNGKQKWS